LVLTLHLYSPAVHVLSASLSKGNLTGTQVKTEKPGTGTAGMQPLPYNEYKKQLT
jgi:hypothetical protein